MLPGVAKCGFPESLIEPVIACAVRLIGSSDRFSCQTCCSGAAWAVARSGAMHTKTPIDRSFVPVNCASLRLRADLGWPTRRSDQLKVQNPRRSPSAVCGIPVFYATCNNQEFYVLNAWQQDKRARELLTLGRLSKSRLLSKARNLSGSNRGIYAQAIHLNYVVVVVVSSCNGVGSKVFSMQTTTSWIHFGRNL